jgi:hypothetical protein
MFLFKSIGFPLPCGRKKCEASRLISIYVVLIYSVLYFTHVYSLSSLNNYKLPLPHEIGQFHQSCFTENDEKVERVVKCLTADHRAVMFLGGRIHPQANMANPLAVVILGNLM